MTNTTAEVLAWIDTNAKSFDFAASLKQSLTRYGSLTERQVEAVNRCMARDAARPAQPSSDLGLTAVLTMHVMEQTFATAKANGLKRPKLRLADFVFSLAPATGKNPGAIYVKDRHNDLYLGKIADHRFYCSGEGKDREQAIKDVASDPKHAAIVYGKKFGICAICGRDLSDAESVARGIGPVCADKFGWKE